MPWLADADLRVRDDAFCGDADGNTFSATTSDFDNANHATDLAGQLTIQGMDDQWTISGRCSLSRTCRIPV